MPESETIQNPRPRFKPRREMNRLSKIEIPRINRETEGRFYQSPFFLDYVSEIDALGEIAVSGGIGLDQFKAFEAPTIIGGVKLYPLTIAGRYWLVEIAYPALDGNTLSQMVAIAYAMNQRGRKLCEELTDARKVQKEVKRFARSLTCSPLILHRYIEKMLRYDPFGSVELDEEGNVIPDPDRELIFDLGPALAVLLREYGQSPGYWLHECPEDFITTCIDDYKMREAAARSVGSDAPNIHDPAVAAFNNLKTRCREIVEEINVAHA